MCTRALVMPEKTILTREKLLNGDVDRLLHNDQKDLPRMPDNEREALIQSTIKELDDTDLWVFGYGSLIWNPAMEVEEQRRCTISGYQKKFCFWTTLSRGSRENPGLMMGLLEGGECHGVAFRISSANVTTELDVLFRREMSHYIYLPTWVTAQCADTNQSFKTLTFVVDVNNPRFAHNLDRDQTIRTLATAEGPLGRNCDYLFQLSEKLQELGFEDTELLSLSESVRNFQAGQKASDKNIDN